MNRHCASRITAWLCGLALGLAGCSARPPQEPSVDMAAVKADLEVVARARVLFAHQSVGRNVLAGVQTLAEQAGVPLRIEPITGQYMPQGPGLFHLQVGSNGEPRSKIDAFDRLLAGATQPTFDAALVKLCYEDLAHDAKGTSGLLEHYGASVQRLQASRPGMRLIHATVPLRADPPGWKTPIKRLLGRETEEDADNALRNAYNEALRARFAQGPLFDVAAVESTRPDGSRSRFGRQGAAIYTLAPEYSADGGHLNELGRRQAAAAFLHSLARALAPAR